MTSVESLWRSSRHRALGGMAVAYEPHRVPITRIEYEELVRRGAFEDARVELLYGRIASMSPIRGPHRYSVARLARILRKALTEERARIDVQSSFAAPDESEPEPDVLVVPPGDYLDAPPRQAWLLVEVADSSLARDRAKARLYGAAGVPEYWIINLIDWVVEVHREPRVDGYESITRHLPGDVLRLVSFEDVEVPVADVLPPRER
jgi:Uma2 family endonuclease